MNANTFRQYYEYHFSENRKVWDLATGLPDEAFRQDVPYSHGSVREQILHLIDAENAWFSDLRAAAGHPYTEDPALEDRASIRAHWDAVEARTRDYLADLQDEMLFTQPLEGEDENLYLWQVLLHVVNHGTDHRAQILRVLNDLGVETTYQDYVFHVYQYG